MIERFYNTIVHVFLTLQLLYLINEKKKSDLLKLFLLSAERSFNVITLLTNTDVWNVNRFLEDSWVIQKTSTSHCSTKLCAPSHPALPPSALRCQAMALGPWL